MTDLHSPPAPPAAQSPVTDVLGALAAHRARSRAAVARRGGIATAVAAAGFLALAHVVGLALAVTAAAGAVLAALGGGLLWKLPHVRRHFNEHRRPPRNKKATHATARQMARRALGRRGPFSRGRRGGGGGAGLRNPFRRRGGKGSAAGGPGSRRGAGLRKMLPGARRRALAAAGATGRRPGKGLLRRRGGAGSPGGTGRRRGGALGGKGGAGRARGLFRRRNRGAAKGGATGARGGARPGSAQRRRGNPFRRRGGASAGGPGGARSRRRGTGFARARAGGAPGPARRGWRRAFGGGAKAGAAGRKRAPGRSRRPGGARQGRPTWRARAWRAASPFPGARRSRARAQARAARTQRAASKGGSGPPPKGSAGWKWQRRKQRHRAARRASPGYAARRARARFRHGRDTWQRYRRARRGPRPVRGKVIYARPSRRRQFAARLAPWLFRGQRGKLGSLLNAMRGRRHRQPRGYSWRIHDTRPGGHASGARPSAARRAGADMFPRPAGIHPSAVIPGEITAGGIAAAKTAREGASAMGNRMEAVIEAITEQIGSARPENVDEFRELLNGLPQIFDAFDGALTSASSNFEDMPIASSFVDKFKDVGSSLAGARDAADELPGAFETDPEHEELLKRIDNPRPNEEFWDVKNQESAS